MLQKIKKNVSITILSTIFIKEMNSNLKETGDEKKKVKTILVSCDSTFMLMDQTSFLLFKSS